MNKSRTLNLDGVVPSWKDGSEEQKALEQIGVEYINELGLELPAQPMVDGKPFIPRVPLSLDALDDRGLSNLHIQFVAYHGYATAQRSLAKVRYWDQQARTKYIEAEIMVMLPPPEVSKRTRARVDPRMKKQERKELIAKTKLEMVDVIATDAEIKRKGLSREVAIRCGELEGIKRADNIERTPRKRGGGLPGGKRVG